MTEQDWLELERAARQDPQAMGVWADALEDAGRTAASVLARVTAVLRRYPSDTGTGKRLIARGGPPATADVLLMTSARHTGGYVEGWLEQGILLACVGYRPGPWDYTCYAWLAPPSGLRVSLAVQADSDTWMDRYNAPLGDYQAAVAHRIWTPRLVRAWEDISPYLPPSA